ncbi:MAG: LysR family transcriptional regulator [Cyanobacteria bacterium J06598_3]
MDRLACIKSFVRTVETGSFSAVAKETQMTQPTISKQIAALEKYLDVQLLTRSTRKLQLTEAGTQFYAHCQEILDTVAAAEASVGKRQQPSGTLRINCPVTFGQLMIMPHLKAFLAQYPQIKVDLMMSDRVVNLVKEGVDLAIRIGTHNEASLIAERIGTTRLVTVAAASYLEQVNDPKTPQDLVDHNCLIYTRLETPNDWQFQDPLGSSVVVKVKGNLSVDNSVAIRQAVLSGLGIAVAPIWLFGDELTMGNLKMLLSDYSTTPVPMKTLKLL